MLYLEKKKGVHSWERVLRETEGVLCGCVLFLLSWKGGVGCAWGDSCSPRRHGREAEKNGSSISSSKFYRSYYYYWFSFLQIIVCRTTIVDLVEMI